MTLFRTNILKLAETANQTWSLNCRRNLTGTYTIKPHVRDEPGRFLAPRGTDEE